MQVGRIHAYRRAAWILPSQLIDYLHRLCMHAVNPRVAREAGRGHVPRTHVRPRAGAGRRGLEFNPSDGLVGWVGWSMV